MKRMKKTLVMMAGIIMLLGLGVSASADSMQGLLYVGNGVTGRNVAECNYVPIYAFGQAWATFGAPAVCQVYAFKHAQWTVGTGNCDTAQFQTVVLRNSNDTIAWGTWVAAQGAISYASINGYYSRVDTGSGWSACQPRDMLGYSMISN